MQKSELRSYIRSVKKGYTSEELSFMSENLCRQILVSDRWKESRIVLLYHALPDEVDTKWLLEDALREHKTILLPVVQGENLTLCLYDGQTREGAYGIQEPVGKPFVDLKFIELALVPGMAFDGKNCRLGRGKGYYDRLLPLLNASYKIGLCFPFQMCENIPTETHDIPMDEVVSRIECQK